jgi:uncharacterized protein
MAERKITVDGVELWRGTENSVAVATGEPVSFDSHGATIVGRLFRAAFADGPMPAVAIIGPENYQKEQAPMQYGPRLAQLGYTALIFDPRYRGESSGEPRCYEDPAAKIEDLRAALDYLTSLPDVDDGRLALVGICFGGGYVLSAAATDPRVRAVASVAAHLRDAAADAGWLGGEDIVAARLARGRAAQEKYERVGEVDYVPCVDASRDDVGMPGHAPWSWYQLWADRGLWENRYAVMSDAAVLSYETLSAAARLTAPLLMIHSDACAQPDAAHRHFAVVPTADKRLLWEGETRHLQYYDDPVVIDRAVWSIVDWFATHLGPGRAAARPRSSIAARADSGPTGNGNRRREQTAVVERFFDLLGRKDIDAWGELWHDDARIIVPYPPEGFPGTIEGKAVIVAGFRDMFSVYDTFESTLTGVYPADPDVVCVEYRNHATLADGTVYTNENIAVFQFEDGLIRSYRDYFDPRRFQAVVDALPDGA